MGATNKTKNIELPIFVDSDKPTWLGDHNDMVMKIDSSIGAQNSKIDQATAIATTAMTTSNEMKTATTAALNEATNSTAKATTAAQEASVNAASAMNAANNLASIANSAKHRADEAYTLANAKYEENSQAFHAYVHTNNYDYDFVTISGKTPIPFKKVQTDDMCGQVSATSMKDLHQIIKEQHYSIAIGGDNPRGSGNTTLEGASYVVPAGLQINGSKALQNFGVMGNGMVGGDQDALLVYPDGRVQTAYRSDGKVAQEYVDQGVVMSITGGPVCIDGGVARVIPNSQYSDYLAYIGGWTIIGKTKSNQWFFCLVYARDDEPGCSLSEITTQCIAQGAQTAIVVATGTSVHMSWGNYIVHPSSQMTNKGDYTWYMLSVPRANEYDTGWIPIPNVKPSLKRLDESPTSSAMSFKQHNDTVYCNISATVDHHKGRDWKVITDGSPFKDRFCSDPGHRNMSGFVNGFWGHIYTVFFGNDGGENTGLNGMLKMPTWKDEEENDNFKVYGTFNWIAQYAN